MPAYFFYDYETAVELIEETQSVLELVSQGYILPFFRFYEGLIASVMIKKKKDVAKWERTLNESISSFTKWSASAPENYMNKLALIEAEMAVIRGSELASDLYEKSIELAKCNNFLNEEALACEREAIFLIKNGKNDKASKFMSRSYDVYLDWGAKAKAANLLALYPEYVGERAAYRKKNEAVDFSQDLSSINPSFASSELSMVSELSGYSFETNISRKKQRRVWK